MSENPELELSRQLARDSGLPNPFELTEDNLQMLSNSIRVGREELDRLRTDDGDELSPSHDPLVFDLLLRLRSQEKVAKKVARGHADEQMVKDFAKELDESLPSTE